MNSRLIFFVILGLTFAVVKCGDKKEGLVEEICGQGQGDSKPESLKEKKEETEAEENKDDKKDKKFFFAGDMRVTEKQKEELDRARLTGQKRDATKRENAKWPNGTVYYEIDRRLGKEAEDAIQAAIRDIEEYTCITFVKRIDRSIEHFVKFIKDQGCWSYVGMLSKNALRQGYKQELSLGRGCEYKGTAIHEIFHALGFEHEQSRPDRDKYVKINFQNIEQSQKHNFNKLENSINFVNYDYNSIMHYPDWAFSKNGKPTIEPVGGAKGAEIGQRDGMTAGDIEQVNRYYECDKESGSGSGSGSNKDKSCTQILKRGMSDNNNEKDKNGSNGSNGDNGNNGDSGNNGDNSSNGDSGNNGNNSNNGDSGNNGDNSSNGDNGNKGDNGSNGSNGSNGDNANNGDSGSKGENGNNEDDGNNGNNGNKGENGDNGSNGDNGNNGNKDGKGNEGEKKPSDKKGGKCEAQFEKEQKNKARKMARKEELMRQQQENIKRREKEERLANMLKKRKKH